MIEINYLYHQSVGLTSKTRQTRKTTVMQRLKPIRAPPVRGGEQNKKNKFYVIIKKITIMDKFNFKIISISIFIYMAFYSFIYSLHDTIIQAIIILAIFKMPFMHRLTKSMAENTYVHSKGKNIIKTKIDRNPSKSLKQEKQRLRMKVTVDLCKLFDPVIHMGFPERPISHTEWNAFNSASQAAVTVTDELEATVDFEAIRVAKGSLVVVEEIRVVKDVEAHSLTVSHLVETFGYGMNKDDVLHIVVVEQEKMRSRVYPLNERQDEKPATVTIPSSWEMENLAVYVFMLSANGRKASNSVFVTPE